MALSFSVYLCLKKRNIFENNIDTLIEFMESDVDLSKSTFLVHKGEID